MMKCITVRKKKLTLLTLNRKRGGEGSVYCVGGHPNLVAKVYHSANTSKNKRRKLETMLASRPRRFLGNSDQLAWPRDILLNEAGQFIGFTMAAAKEGSDELCAFTHKARRTMHHPDVTRRTFYRIAINLCHALDAVHKLGHVVGDFNPNNIMCREDGTVTLIDTDSFNIRKKGSSLVFPCEVGMNDYIAPEIQNRNRGEVQWQQEHDYFALAVHLFQILLENRHPFAATPKSGVAPAEYASKLIVKGVYPHVSNSETKFDDITDFLPKSIREAFRKTFVDGFADPKKRLTPKEWTALLKRELKALKQCHVCPEQYEAEDTHCPYCLAAPANVITRCWNSISTQAVRLKKLRASTMPAAKKKKKKPPKVQPLGSRNGVLGGLSLIVTTAIIIGTQILGNIGTSPNRHVSGENRAQQPTVSTQGITLTATQQPKPPKRTPEEEFSDLIELINRWEIVPAGQATIRHSPDGTPRYEYESRDYAHQDGAILEFEQIKARMERFAQRSGSFREEFALELKQHFIKGRLFRSDTRSILILIEEYSETYRAVVIAQ